MTSPSRLHVTLDIGAELGESPTIEISRDHSEVAAPWLHLNTELFGLCIRPGDLNPRLVPASPEHVEFADQLATQVRIWADAVKHWAEGLWAAEAGNAAGCLDCGELYASERPACPSCGSARRDAG